MLVTRRGSALVSDFGGAGKMLPVLAGVLLFAGLASLALPGTAPFVSEFLVLIGTFTVNKTVAVVATVGIILAAGVRAVDGAAHHPGHAQPGAAAASGRCARTSSLREALVVAPLIALLLFFGFYPKPLLDVINPAVAATMHDVGKSDPAPDRARATGGRQVNTVVLADINVTARTWTTPRWRRC